MPGAEGRTPGAPHSFFSNVMRVLGQKSRVSYADLQIGCSVGLQTRAQTSRCHAEAKPGTSISFSVVHAYLTGFPRDWIYSSITRSRFPCSRKTYSMASRTAPWPPARGVT